MKKRTQCSRVPLELLLQTPIPHVPNSVHVGHVCALRPLALHIDHLSVQVPQQQLRVVVSVHKSKRVLLGCCWLSRCDVFLMAIR